MNAAEPFIITMIQDLANVSHLVNKYFKDESVTTQWMNTDNPGLNNKSPSDMIFAGNTAELIKFIEVNISS